MLGWEGIFCGYFPGEQHPNLQALVYFCIIVVIVVLVNLSFPKNPVIHSVLKVYGIIVDVIKIIKRSVENR